MSIAELRQEYHRQLCQKIIRINSDKKGKDIKYPNFADGNNVASVKIAWHIVESLSYTADYEIVVGQTSGGRFEVITKDFLQKAFELLYHLRPGQWIYSTKTSISKFDQYDHLADLGKALKEYKKLATVFDQYDHLTDLGKALKEYKKLATVLRTDYIIKPDIVISRLPVLDEEINLKEKVVDEDTVAKLTPFRRINFKNSRPILHASISCKWTLRSDRGQNARTEALNLIRNRKGHLPHIVAVTAEPLPTRIASLALGTGDLDCVYHFALPELRKAISQIKNEDQLDMLTTLIEDQRLRDISDLPFDLAT